MSETKTTESYPAVSHAEQAPLKDRQRKSIASPHAEHGALIDHDVPQDEAVQAEPDLLWSRIRHYFRDPFSEFFGVFILILFGDGVVAQVVLSNGTKGSYQSISWGWG
jgi:aquaglyceroporin related protein, other eukaryote